MLDKLVNGFESYLFRHRAFVIFLFTVATIFLGLQASNLKMDAAFVKNIPLNHSYMQTYLKHQKQFGGANSIMVAVEDTSGNIFNANFFDTLKNVHDQLFFIPGVDRAQVKSLFSPSTRFTEVVEDGFAGGPVIPADFSTTEYGLKVVQGNIEKAGIVGRLIAEDYSAAMVSAQLMDFDPQTGEALDTLAFAAQLEEQLREQYETDAIKIHIIGFAKMAGDVADGAKGVLLFFLIAILVTAVMVYFFSKSVALTILPLVCSLVAVIWQLGLLTVVGFGLDPMSILIPFLVFAIGVSHSVQMINAVRRRVTDGQTTKAAAALAFRSLLIPGGVALLSDTIGFMTLLAIDIGIIRELAISASLGVAVIILTNLMLLPLLISYTKVSPNHEQQPAANPIWLKLSKFATLKYAVWVLAVTAVLYAVGLQQANKMKVGDLQGGAPALHLDSRYNQDTFFITDKFSITTDVMTVIVEAFPEACTYHSVLTQIDEFEWLVGNTPGVESTASLASVAKRVNAGFNEGNPKWSVLPRTTASLVQAVGQVPTTSGLLNSDCSVMPVYLFLEDHKAETIEPVIAKVNELKLKMDNEQIQFKLASGPVGVMAATNEAVAEAQLPMMLYVYGAVFILCLISFRSLRATIAVILPLYVVSTLAQALMTQLDIGLAVSTLPVIALGVGIGVDYGIYILSTMAVRLRDGMPVQQAYYEALVERGSAVIFTGLTLAIGVSTWFFSALKFQMDMGILLTFMFLVNMLGAIIILPAIAALFWRQPK
ncbi:efflux RND transporter permease subunit [Shewanella fidelis]|uniref:MMPL family transporter n=1 Tax=Shewanella fidelis TaxID=173509 RepID=A0AAW8NLN7_9GAMM|nr:MMPL family transporter [Shewanella fidelis]MDR8523675.1 MMPL family transporter [Shewanella fidelis]MDW4810222.1 MMPL family transporter [Shewanella fidelis]MDW4814367.1 MMPL family transporter [Shewanella fidelis]MDW4818458.1 MMPL family transporter [Shewanella fidelis]MDW4823890.1 MMPL family transporter [Shewanella fidelis]